MFKLLNTFTNVASPTNAQRGQPAPGSGAQQTGNYRKPPREDEWRTRIPYEGTNTWFEEPDITYGNPQFPVDAQRGQPAATAPNQQYPRGALGPKPRMDGTTYYRVTRPFSRGAQREAPITPIIFTPANPGDLVPFKPSVVPRYPLGQYINNTIFWANQVIPTSIPLSGLQTEKAIQSILSTFEVYGEAQTL
jgi:hypothetical protein